MDPVLSQDHRASAVRDGDVGGVKNPAAKEDAEAGRPFPFVAKGGENAVSRSSHAAVKKKSEMHVSDRQVRSRSPFAIQEDLYAGATPNPEAPNFLLNQLP